MSTGIHAPFICMLMLSGDGPLGGRTSKGCCVAPSFGPVQMLRGVCGEIHHIGERYMGSLILSLLQYVYSLALYMGTLCTEGLLNRRQRLQRLKSFLDSFFRILFRGWLICGRRVTKLAEARAQRRLIRRRCFYFTLNFEQID